MKKVDINSPEFRRWFGASKVVDAEGRPLRVYHATWVDSDFDRFRKGKTDLGMHFGSAGQAEDRFLYLSEMKGFPLQDGELWEDRAPAGSRTIPVYLSIQNPIRLPDLGSWGKFSVLLAVSKVLQLGERWADDQSRRPVATHRILMQLGYDGVVYRNTGESEDPTISAALRRVEQDAKSEFIEQYERKNRRKFRGCVLREEQSWPEYIAWDRAQKASREHREGEGSRDSWIAFEPGQIKSAISNRGTYSRKDPVFTNPMSRKRTPPIRENHAADESVRLVIEGPKTHHLDLARAGRAVESLHQGIVHTRRSRVARLKVWHGNDVSEFSAYPGRGMAASVEQLADELDGFIWKLELNLR